MPVKIFFCYSHRDEDFLDQLKTHLSLLQWQGLIESWHDRDISAGTEWEEEIKEHLNTAQIIILLVSPDFMASKYCYSIEMKRAVERHEHKEARVIPVILRYIDWQAGPFGKLQALPKDGKPVKSWPDQDEAFFNVAQGIRKVIEDLQLDRSRQIIREDPYPFPLHFIWIVGCGSSMSGDKIHSLNTAIRESIPEMRKVSASNPHARVMVRAIKFSSGATWHIAQPTLIENFQWVDLTANGNTDMGKALMMVADELKVPPMSPRGLPPVLVLITDSYPTDDVSRGIQAIMDQPWGKKSVRLGIGIGANADYAVLEKFIGNPEIRPLQANNAEQLVNYIKWADETIENKYVQFSDDVW